MKRHLLMHIWPKADKAWRLTLREVMRREAVFDGVRVVAVAVGHDTEPVSAVRAELPRDVHVMEFQNDSSLREVKTFVPLMEHALNREGITFYCHGKGSSHHAESICQEWGRAMCEVLLDDSALVEQALKKYQVVGAMRRDGRFKLRPDNWHYSGTFYWFDNHAVFRTGRAWHDVDPMWYGTESWPGKMFDGRVAGALLLDHCGDLYSEQYWASTVRPALAAFRGDPARSLDMSPDDRCDFVPLRPGYSRCSRCRRVVHDTRLLRVHVCGMRAPAPHNRCQHSEDRMTTVGLTDVYACSEHGACAAAHVGADVHVCPELPGPGRRRDGQCRHLGDRQRGVPCENCGPGKTSPAFACVLHGEAIMHPIHGVSVRDCESCGDFQSLLSEHQVVR